MYNCSETHGRDDGAGVDKTSPFEFEMRDFTLPGESEVVTVKQWPVLAAAEGDMPMMEKFMLSCGHSAKEACSRCAEQGTHLARAVRCASKLAYCKLAATENCRSKLATLIRPRLSQCWGLQT